MEKVPETYKRDKIPLPETLKGQECRLKVLQGRKKVKRFSLDATTVPEPSRM